MRYWLIKSEPDVFSIKHLRKVKQEPWNGVRNYQARNFMRDDMKQGDLALFYHSNTEVPGVVGVAKVVSEAYPDASQWNRKSKYHDSKSSKDNPRWVLVDFAFESEFRNIVTLAAMKADPKLEGMRAIQKGNRLSIVPVEARDFNYIRKLGG